MPVTTRAIFLPKSKSNSLYWRNLPLSKRHRERRNCIISTLCSSLPILESPAWSFNLGKSTFLTMPPRKLSSRTRSTISHRRLKCAISSLGRSMARERTCLAVSYSLSIRRVAGPSMSKTSASSRPCKVSLACASIIPMRCP
jgi:hypothetical protein